MGTTLQNYCKYAQSHHMIFNYSLKLSFVNIFPSIKQQNTSIIYNKYNRFWKSSIMFCL